MKALTNSTKTQIQSDILQKLKSLYKEAFSEDSDFSRESFFKKVNASNAEFVFNDENSELISCGYVMDKDAYLFGEDMTLPYLSALATNKKYRGKGHIKTIISNIINKLYDRGDMVCALYPFNHDYYKRFDFCNISFCERRKIVGGKQYKIDYLADLKNIDSLVLELEKLQNEFNSHRDNYIVLSKKALKDKICELYGDGCKVTKIIENNQIIAILCVINGNIEYYVTHSIKKMVQCEQLNGYSYYNFEKSDEPYVQGRIVNVKKAFQKANYCDSFVGQKVISVSDDMIAQNNLTLLLKRDKISEKVTVFELIAKSDNDVDMHLNISQATSLIMCGDGKLVNKQNNLFIEQY